MIQLAMLKRKNITKIEMNIVQTILDQTIAIDTSNEVINLLNALFPTIKKINDKFHISVK